MQIANYFASLGISIDRKSINKVDNVLKGIETRLKRFSTKANKHLNITLDVNKFNIDQRKLNTAIGNALDLVSAKTVFQVNRFNIDQAQLNRSMAAAMRNASRMASRAVNATGKIQRDATVGGRGISSSRHMVAAGGVGGLASRIYGPAIALGLGGYGLGQLNQRNQQVVAAQLQTQAVVQQAGGTPEQGTQAFDWLRNQANRIGFNYLEAAPDYSKLLSGLTGAGMTVSEGQEVFKGFSELSRVNKLDRTAQNRVYRALSQIAGKNQLQSDELTGQLAESLPGAVALFAQAYQDQTDGSKTGQEAITELRDAMKKGLVKGDILTSAGKLASKKAKSGLEAASKASQAEQARFQNTISDKAILASTSGVESGFARLFRALNNGLKESGPMVESLARGFDNVSKSVSFALLSVQSLQRFFEGRDSYLGDKFFPTEEDKQKAFVFLEQVKTLMGELKTLGGNIYTGWEKLLGLLEGSTILDKLTTTISTIANAAEVINSLVKGDISSAADAAQTVGKRYANLLVAPGIAGVSAIVGGVNTGLDLIAPSNPFLGRLPAIDAPFSKTDSELDWKTRYKAEQAMLANEAVNRYALPGINQPLGSAQSSTNLEIKMDVTIQAANPEDFNNQFQDKVKTMLGEALLQYGQKE